MGACICETKQVPFAIRPVSLYAVAVVAEGPAAGTVTGPSTFPRWAPITDMPGLALTRHASSGGDSGTYAVMRKMWQLARGPEGSKDPAIRQLAYCITSRTPSRDQAAEIRAVGAWIRQNVRFHNEDGEVVATPKVTLGWNGFAFNPAAAGGDCDDLAVLAGALLSALGIDWHFKAVGPQNARSHVYIEAIDRRTGEAIGIDPTRPETPAAFAQAQFRPMDGGRSTLGDPLSAIQGILSTPAVSDIFQGLATKIAYPTATLNQVGISSAPNPFAPAATVAAQSASTFFGVPASFLLLGGGALFLLVILSKR